MPVFVRFVEQSQTCDLMDVISRVGYLKDSDEQLVSGIQFNTFNIQHIENVRRESTLRLTFAAAPPSIARGEKTAVLLPGE